MAKYFYMLGEIEPYQVQYGQATQQQQVDHQLGSQPTGAQWEDVRQGSHNDLHQHVQ